MDAKVTWERRMSFTGSADTGFSLRLDAAPSVGGDNSGFRPLELLLIGLAGCTGMDVISLLNKMRQEVTAFEVRAHAEQAGEHPRVFTHVKVEYLVSGRSVDPSMVERAIELSVTRYCPAQAMLGKAVVIEQTYRVEEQSVEPLMSA
jgi:putative redox protein